MAIFRDEEDPVARWHARLPKMPRREIEMTIMTLQLVKPAVVLPQVIDREIDLMKAELERRRRKGLKP